MACTVSADGRLDECGGHSLHWHEPFLLGPTRTITQVYSRVVGVGIQQKFVLHSRQSENLKRTVHICVQTIRVAEPDFLIGSGFDL
jgi:hypothetical protein